MTTLTLVLPLVRPTPGTEFDYVVSRERGVVLNHGTATAALLPRADQLVLVVPAAALSWHPARLPPVAASRRRAALDGLLEERLLDDPAQLALALAPARLANGDALVAAFDKAWIRAHLEFFEQSGRPAARVVPEFSPGADGAAGAVWHVTGTPQDAHLVVVQPQGLLHLPLHSALSVIGSRPDVSGGDKVLAEPAVAELAEQVLGFAALVQPVVQRVCDAGASEWDLAQFDLSLSGGGRVARRWRQYAGNWLRAPSWRAARWGLVALLLAHLVGLNAWAWKLDAALRERQQLVKSSLTQTFPEIRTVVDAPLQMQRQLALLRRSSGALAADDMEAMLAAMGASLPTDSQAKSIDYAPGQLTLRGLVLPEPVLARLREDLGARAYRLQAEGDRLVMRAGAAP
ncbi:MAG: general secretion pathway protein GspL [Rhodoferax sp.]|nr:general secretion pathway protein GspL [Rhodoferax sp.]